MSKSSVTGQFRIGGVLQDAATAKMSDETGTFGVKRLDNDAVVVADGTDMTRQSIGTYSFTWTDPAFDLNYEYAIEFVSDLGVVYRETGTFAGTPSPVATPAVTESELSVTYWDIVSRVADYMGFGINNFEDTTRVGAGLVVAGEDYRRIRSYIDAGYRQFLFPPIVPTGGSERHEWSFLPPETTLTTVADQWQYDLPAGFAGLIGEFQYDSDISGLTISNVTQNEIRRRRAVATVTGKPWMAAVSPKPFVPGTGQRYQVSFYPTPDTALTIYAQYNISPALKLSDSRTQGHGAISADQITLIDADIITQFDTAGVEKFDRVVLYHIDDGDGRPRETIVLVNTVDSGTQLTLNPTTGGTGAVGFEVYAASIYPHGGTEHAETIIASCCAIAEWTQEKIHGPAWEQFMTLLSSSVSSDLNKGAKTLGYNGNGRGDRRLSRFSGLIFNNGVEIT